MVRHFCFIKTIKKILNNEIIWGNPYDDFVDRNNVPIIPTSEGPNIFANNPKFAVFNDAWKVYDDASDTNQAM